MSELEPKETAQTSAEMPFYAHFVELRSRLLRIAAAILVGTIVCFSFAPAKVRTFIYIASDLFKSLSLFNIRSCAICLLTHLGR